MHETYTGNEWEPKLMFIMELGLVFINALTYSFLTEKVIQNAHDLVSWACQKREEDELFSENEFCKATKEGLHIYSATKGAS